LSKINVVTTFTHQVFMQIYTNLHKLEWATLSLVAFSIIAQIMPF